VTGGRQRTLVFDCFSGIAGDMTLAALVDAGAALEEISRALTSLRLPAVDLTVERVTRGGMGALLATVAPSEERRFSPQQMKRIVEAGALPERTREQSLSAVDILAAAESRAHGGAADFHEVGGVDAVVDIVGTMLALDLLGIDTCVCPVVTVGAGTVVRAAHGAIPAAPGPAAAEILEAARFPLRFVEASHELVTPTGAAILAAVASPGPAVIVPESHGAGAGSRDTPERPNALRVFIGEPQRDLPGSADLPDGTRPLSLLEANIDDMTAALLANARDRLLEEGALDAWTEPIGMKKGRAATKLCALVAAGDEERLSRLMLLETSTLGVRVAPYRRYELERTVETRQSTFGTVRVKVSVRGGIRRAEPEYDDVVAIARREGMAAREIQRRLELEFGQASGD